MALNAQRWTLMDSIGVAILPVVLTLGLALVIVVPVHFVFVGLFLLLKPRPYVMLGEPR